MFVAFLLNFSTGLNLFIFKTVFTTIIFFNFQKPFIIYWEKDRSSSWALRTQRILQKQEKVNQRCEGGQETRGRSKDGKAQEKHSMFHGNISSAALNQVNQSLWLTLDFHLCTCMFHPVCAALSALAFLLCTLPFLDEKRIPSSLGISEHIQVGGTVSSD